MGIFDFLKRGNPSPPAPQVDHDGPSAHYALAHIALRKTALDDPLRCLAILDSPQAKSFIAAILESVSRLIERPAEFSAQMIEVHPVNVNNYPCVIVEMPEPSESGQAHFAALVVLVNSKNGLPPNSQQLRARYFTLEKGLSHDGRSRTVFAEWDRSTHMNYGDGPEPTIEAFVGRIETLFK